MWIPHFLLEFWEPQSPPETIQASQADTTERDFLIIFWLENPPARGREVELRLEKTITVTQIDGRGRKADVQFQTNKDMDLDRVAFQVKDSNPRAAFRYCHDRLTQLLSVWAVRTGSGFSIMGFLITDVQHEAKWKVVPQRAASEPFQLPIEIMIDKERGALLSLYREGRNSPSPFYRFLCFYKILEALYRHGSIFGQADRIIRERSLSFRRPQRQITHDMLVTSFVFTTHPEFENVSLGRCFELLNPWRVKVAHAITESGDFVNLDEYQAQIELGPIANLVDQVARQILLDEGELWEQIAIARGR